ncbi:SMP-30/gluconolactonase/LRE family protein [Flavitalea flava]
MENHLEPAGNLGQDSQQELNSGLKPERSIEDVLMFADGLDHPECVAVHPDGSVWAGGEGGQIYRILPDGSGMEEVGNTGGFILGLAFSPDGSWLAVCDLKLHCIWKFNIAEKRLELLASTVEQLPVSIPNFPVFDGQGNLYVSDSGAFRTVTGRVYRFDAEGKGMIWHAGPFSFANGMALSVKKTFLYVVCTWLPGVERIKINPDGSAGEREIYVTLPRTCPDGIAFDAAGNLYIGCYAPNRIYKVSPDRILSVFLDDWESHTLTNPTNLAFGGGKFTDLFIANLGRWHIGKIRIGQEGLKLACHE